MPKENLLPGDPELEELEDVDTPQGLHADTKKAQDQSKRRVEKLSDRVRKKLGPEMTLL